MFDHGVIGYLIDWKQLDIGRKDLVLDLGSGHKPFVRADVLLDMFVGDDIHRAEALLLDERPFVCGDMCRLPFRDKAFDYVTCFHVLEHLTDPEAAIEEMMRVSRRGLITTPSPLCEDFFGGLGVHRWVVDARDGALLLTQKTRGVVNPVMNQFTYGLPASVHRGMPQRFLKHYDQYMETRYEWSDSIRYQITYADHVKEEAFSQADPCSGASSRVSMRSRLRASVIRATGRLVRKLAGRTGVRHR